jgi:predicted amidophosphoribosyltransferase
MVKKLCDNCHLYYNELHFYQNKLICSKCFQKRLYTKFKCNKCQKPLRDDCKTGICKDCYIDSPNTRYFQNKVNKNQRIRRNAKK